MSHEGTAWAIRQRGLKPTTRIVSWHLADRHNPDFGCFPSQERLAEDAEISRSTLNARLEILKEQGLIRRESRVNERTKRQMGTRYILAFESDFTQDRAEPCAEIGHGAVSEKTPEPCPKNSESRVQNSDTDLVREPLREPVRRARARGAVGSDRFDEFWAVYPHKVEETAARRAWGKVADDGNEDGIIAAARAYADDDRVKRGFPKQPANWLIDRCWDVPERPDAACITAATTQHVTDLDALSGLWVPKILAGHFVPASAISVRLARHMRENGLVTDQQLRRVGVSF